MPRTRKRNVRRKAPKRKPKSFNAKVKKAIQGAAEKKTSNGNPATYVFQANNSINPVPVSLVTQTGGVGTIGLGTSNGSRIGNKINVTKATLKMMITPNAILFPAVLQIMIGTVKTGPMTAPSTGELDEIFDDGFGSSGFDVTRLSLLRNINRDLFTIHRYMKIKCGPADASTTNSNNDFPFMIAKTINLRSLLGTWKFNDDVTMLPTNKNLFMWCHWIAANNGAQTSADPAVDFYTVVEYTDI